MSRRSLMLPLANALSDLLPGIGLSRFAVEGSQRTHAAWPVWRDSTTKPVKFMPLPKKQAVKLYHKARAFERQTRRKGKQDGALGRNGLAVLHALIFDFLDYATGELDRQLRASPAKPAPVLPALARPAQSQALRRVELDTPRRGDARRERPVLS